MRQRDLVKTILRLRQRNERARTGTFFVEGIRPVAEALAAGVGIQRLVVAPELLKSTFAQTVVETARARGIECVDVPAVQFTTLSLRDNPAGIGAVVRQTWHDLRAVNLIHGLGVVAIDRVQDPGNLGTVLRTCDAVGVSAIILLDQSTDPYHPTAVRASMGSIFGRMLIRESFDGFAEWVRQENLTVVGTSGAAALNYRCVSYDLPAVLLIGSEREGLAPSHLALCQMVVGIPMVGNVDSLNVAVATSIVLYEMFHQLRGQDMRV